MKRFHVHVGVENLDKSIAFYEGLFGKAPTLVKPDYAKWMLDDPHLNFAISARPETARGVEHLGLQVDSDSELHEVYARLRQTGGPIIEEGATTCCYAQSEKHWISDPDGVMWEAFLTTGDSTDYGSAPARDAVTKDTACCTPQTPQGRCCPPKPQLAANAPCCA